MRHEVLKVSLQRFDQMDCENRRIVYFLNGSRRPRS
jgi:hypothetical protein